MPNHRPERKRATLRELSEITGLSTAGVSYALRGQRVSPPTERRVRAAADRIGFRSDPIARALRGGRTELVGVVGGSLADLWHQQFVTSLQGSLRRHGLRMVLADAAGDAQEELALARDLAAQRCDGLIVLPIENVFVFSVQIGRGIESMPWWITLAVMGAVLLIIAVTAERRTGEAGTVAARMRDLR